MNPLIINIMTATLAPGDAIGNYIMSQRRILQGWGVRVRLFADVVAPVYGMVALPSELYRPSGRDILLYHYSIYTNNINHLINTPDYTIMDFHGVTPPHLFYGTNDYVAGLCQQALDLLPDLPGRVNHTLVHSTYTHNQLTQLGFPEPNVHKIPLCIDTSRYPTTPSTTLAQTLRKLSYLLFVGRLVRQKDIIALLTIFQHLHTLRPDLVLILVGSRAIDVAYQEEIDTFIEEYKLGHRVLFTGQVNDPAGLATLFQQAQLTLITSEWESFCVPIVESAFFGTPLAVCNTPPLPEVMGPAGITINKNQPQQAAQQIHTLLNNPDRYASYQTAAQQWASNYTDTTLAHNLLTLLRHIFHLGDRTQRKNPF